MAEKNICLEGKRIRITFDAEYGRIVSLYNKLTGLEMVQEARLPGAALLKGRLFCWTQRGSSRITTSEYPPVQIGVNGTMRVPKDGELLEKRGHYRMSNGLMTVENIAMKVMCKLLFASRKKDGQGFIYHLFYLKKGVWQRNALTGYFVGLL